MHLHNREIVHMDLKSPNILLGKDLTAKIADVGLARSVTNSSLTQMTSIGTMAWAAPELKRNFKIGRKDGPRTVSAKADVFRYTTLFLQNSQLVTFLSVGFICKPVGMKLGQLLADPG